MAEDILITDRVEVHEVSVIMLRYASRILHSNLVGSTCIHRLRNGRSVQVTIGIPLAGEVSRAAIGGVGM